MMSKRLFYALFIFYALTVSAMEDVRVVIPDAPLQEVMSLSNRAVELYFRGNAHTLHAMLLPLIALKLQRAQQNGHDSPVLNDLEYLSVYNSNNVSMTDSIHTLVTESIEEALNNKERQLEERERRLASQRRQRNAALVTAW